MAAAIALGVRLLRESSSPSPRLDAEVLLAHVMGRERTWILAHPEAPVESDPFDELVRRRAEGEPIAYIRGFKEWHSLRIQTDARALIPRPETELLADAAMADIADRLLHGPVCAWEVATGSGAVALATALRFRSELESGALTLIASDISTDALDLAADNLASHGVGDRVSLRQADLIPSGAPRLDVIVANLPYVSSAEVDARQGSLGFEPRVAVDGGPDGLSVLRRLLHDLPAKAAPGATVLLEIDSEQQKAVESLAPEGASVSIVPDLAGLDRVIRLQMPD